MSTEKWIAGATAGWANIFNSGADLNSIVNGNAILASANIDNSTNLDIFMDVSLSLGSLTSGSGSPYVGLYLYPLNQDGTSYGDGRFGSSAAGPPPSDYYIGRIPLVPSVTQVQTGTLRGIILPPGIFRLVAFNQAGATLASSANAAKYRTYNRQVV